MENLLAAQTSRGLVTFIDFGQTNSKDTKKICCQIFDASLQHRYER